MNDQDGKTPKHPELGYVANFKVLEEMQAKAGPHEPDIGMLCYDPDTEEGQAHLRAYQDRYRQACRDAALPGPSLSAAVDAREGDALGSRDRMAALVCPRARSSRTWPSNTRVMMTAEASK